MKHKPKTKQQILAELEWDKECKYTLKGGRVGLLTTLAILIDVWCFTEEDVHVFEEKYMELMNSYNEGHEDPIEWVKVLETDYHLDVLSDLWAMK